MTDLATISTERLSDALDYIRVRQLRGFGLAAHSPNRFTGARNEPLNQQCFASGIAAIEAFEREADAIRCELSRRAFS